MKSFGSLSLSVLAAALGLACFTSDVRAGTYDGRWALLQTTTTIAQVPIAGRIYATTTAISLHDLTDDGGRLRGGGTLCALTLDSGTPFVDTILPPALRRVLPTPAVDAEIVSRNGRVGFWQVSPTIVLGARLDRPDAPLPTDEDDPRVFDQDRDGEPGVTVRVEGIASGDLHVVQRSWSRLDGGLLVDGTFGGVVRHGLAQTVLGSTSPFLTRAPDSTPVPASSFFRLGRLSRGATCADAVRRAGGWQR